MIFIFNDCDVKKDGRIQIDEFLDFFGGYERHWRIPVPSNYPDSFKGVAIM